MTLRSSDKLKLFKRSSNSGFIFCITKKDNNILKDLCNLTRGRKHTLVELNGLVQMSQDELDELFGEEMAVDDSSTILEEPLKVSKLSGSEDELQNFEEEEDAEEEEGEELTFTNETNEVTLPSIQKLSSLGLIVICVIISTDSLPPFIAVYFEITRFYWQQKVEF